VPEVDDDGRFLLDLEELADARRFHSLDCTCDSDPLGRCVVHNDVEAARLSRIAAGEEHACAGCGCSETRACEGGCVWATETLCSRCV
jgi:hypothetical protein